MPDEKVAESPSASPGPEPASPAEELGADTQGGDAEGQRIPYDRFKQVNDQKKEAEARAEQAERAAAEATERIKQWQQWYVANQQQDAKRQPAAASSNGSSDPAEEHIKSLFGQGEEGEARQKAMDQYFEWRKTKEGLVTRSEVEQMVRDASNQTYGRFQGAVNITNRFQKWEDSGMISAEESGRLQETLNKTAREHNVADENGLNYIAERLVVNAIESGTIKPFASPPPKNPMVPGGHGGEGPPPPPDLLKESDIRFGKLRGVGDEKLKKWQNESVRRHAGAMGNG